MGAWGLGIFQSDHDYDRVGQLSGDAGVYKLEKEDVDAAISQGKKVKMVSDLDRNNEPETKELESAYNKTAMKNAKALHKAGKLVGEIETVSVHYVIYARVCSNPERIRKHLDTGVLARMLKDAEKKLKENYSGEYDSNGYEFVLLGACGMSIGCELSPSIVTMMKKRYKNVGLMRDAKTQMEAALDEDTGYVNGNPWDFGSLGLKETMESGKFAAKEDRINGFQINVPEPGANAPVSPTHASLNLAEKMMMLNVKEENKYGPDQCGQCGAKEGKAGGKLLQCSRCKMRKYCSKECSTEHWKYHKLLCKTYAESGRKPRQAHLKVVAEC